MTAAPQGKIRVLFVCMGNICRSPLAEGVFRHLVKEASLGDRFEIDSAGTSSYHTGDPPDSRTTAVAKRRGITLTGQSRQVEPADLQQFDYVLVMDGENHAAVQRLTKAGAARAAIHRLREFDPDDDDLDVPDPYYGGPDGFENVHDTVERACRAFLDHVRAERGL